MLEQTFLKLAYVIIAAQYHMADLVSEKHFVKNLDLVSISCQLPTIAT